MHFSMSFFCNEIRKKYEATNASPRKICFWKAQNENKEGVLVVCFGFCPQIDCVFCRQAFYWTECEGITTYNAHLPCLLHLRLHSSATAMEKLSSH